MEYVGRARTGLRASRAHPLVLEWHSCRGMLPLETTDRAVPEQVLPTVVLGGFTQMRLVAQLFARDAIEGDHRGA